jgi:hypothetical protein
MKTANSLLALTAALAVAATLVTTPRAQAYPEPSPAARTWQFSFTHGAPRPVAVTGADGNVHWYWCLAYKVVNNTKRERLFVPEIAVATDAGDIVVAGKDVPAGVFRAFKELTGNKLLENPNDVAGKFLLGEDEAKESVAIWPAFKHDIDHLSIFVAGLSGETLQIKNPETGEPVTLRKSLMLNYDLPGRSPRLQDVVVTAGTERWILR